MTFVIMLIANPSLYSLPHKYYTSQILCFFTNWRFVATLHWASLLVPFFFNIISLLYVSVSHFGNSHSISYFFFIVIFVMVVCDQWSLKLLLQKDYDL